jgi:hypothetical protein
MPQLDVVSGFNQSFATSLSFWLLFFLYYLLALVEDSKLLKIDFKIASLRKLFNLVYSKQKFCLYNEIFLARLASLISIFTLQKVTLMVQSTTQNIYLAKFAPDLTKLNSRLYIEIIALH